MTPEPPRVPQPAVSPFATTAVAETSAEIGLDPPAGATLKRTLSLPNAITLAMLDMVGIGPFLTLPLVLAAAGTRYALYAWLLGAAIALMDGLCWAELGATFPHAGGSYAYLREIYGADGPGRMVSFLYVWQLSFSGPLSIASGCIGMASFLSFLVPALDRAPIAALPGMHGSNIAGCLLCLVITFLLYRDMRHIARYAKILFGGVLVTLALVTAAGLKHGIATGIWMPAATPPLPFGKLLPALGAATLIASYDYWGYYNVCFLGSEVKHPHRAIPRAIVISVLAVAAIYITMIAAILPAVAHMTGSGQGSGQAPGSGSHLAVVAQLAESSFGRGLGLTVAALIVWSAFGSVFSILLGYSRVPYAAARDGNYFRALAAVHPRGGFPHRSVLATGIVASAFCFFSLGEVIAALVVMRILLQFLLQQGGLIWLRYRRPELPRPFRMPLFPLPALLAMAGFLFILVSRTDAIRQIRLTALVALVGLVLYLVRAYRQRQWPYRSASKPSNSQ